MSTECPAVNLSHFDEHQSLQAAIDNAKSRIVSRKDLPHVTVEKQLDLLDQLSQFELGRFLIQKGGLNGYWTHYAIFHQCDDSTHPLERFLLDKAPAAIATRERFHIFSQQLQKKVRDGVSLASIPCGLMADLLRLDFSSIATFSLTGIDVDEEALRQAHQLAVQVALNKHGSFQQQDAWQLAAEEEFDVIACSGLTIYEADDDRVVELYRKLFGALKAKGTLITSFLTPPPLPGLVSEWNFSKIDPSDALLQRVIFSDVLGVKWQVFRSTATVRHQLEQVGFVIIEIIYDSAAMFPTIVALKP